MRCKSPFPLKNFDGLCEGKRAWCQTDSPVQAVSLHSQRPCPRKYRNNSPRSLFLFPRLKSGRRHKDSGIKKCTSAMVIYNILLGEGRRYMPQRGCLLSPGGKLGFASSRNHNGRGLVQIACRTDPIPRKTEEKPQLVWHSLEWDVRRQ